MVTPFFPSHPAQESISYSDILSSLELLQLHQPMDESSNLTALGDHEGRKQENGLKAASYTLRSSSLDAEPSDIICKAVLILSSLASLSFHELSNLRSTSGITKTSRIEDTHAPSLSLITASPDNNLIQISVDPQEFSEEPIRKLVNLVSSQLVENSEKKASTSPQPVLLVDFSTPYHQCPSQEKLEKTTREKHSFPLVIQPKDDHLILTVNSNPFINIEPILASWFLLHTVNIFNQIIKQVRTNDEVQNTTRMSSISMVSAIEKEMILKLSKPLQTAHEINYKKPKFVQHFLQSNSLVELILKSADLNSNLIALHWYERYHHGDFDSFSPSNLINNNGSHPNHHPQPKEFEFKLTFQEFAHYSYILSEHIFKSIQKIQSEAEKCSTQTQIKLSNPIFSLLMKKNPWLVMIMFAVSLTGSSYLNLELSTPKNKLKSILKNLDISLLLTFNSYENLDVMNSNETKNLKNELEFENVLDLSSYCSNLQKEILSTSSKNDEETTEDENLEKINAGIQKPLEVLSLYESRMKGIEKNKKRDQIAYLVYTSGTTGQPKPIPISNSNLLSFLFNYSTRFQRKNDGLTKVLQFASYSFDVSVMSIWDTLAHGSTICMTTSENLKSDLVGSIKALKCTTIDLTPTVLNLLIEDELFKSTERLPIGEVREIWNSQGFYLNHVNTGAEYVPVELRKKFLTRGVSVCVDYGPSETTVGAISSLVLHYDPHMPLDDIGRPTGLNEVYLLDSNSELVPLGGVGEICVGGGQVASGYVNSDLSVGKFVQVNLDGDKPTRLYRTGDLGKFLPTGSAGYGSVYFVGRIDSQVKISGVRIERYF